MNKCINVCIFSFSLDCDCDERKSRTVTAKVQLFTPPTSSNPFSSKTEKPVSTQKTAISASNHHTASKRPFSHTESSSEGSIEYIKSADVPEINPTIDLFFTTKRVLPITSTSTTRTSKVIRGRIPWNRLFGSGERERILNRLKRPSIPPKTSTTLQTTPVTPTSATVYTTGTDSPAILENMAPPILTQSKESSGDDDLGGLASTDFEFTTQGPSFHPKTTTSLSDYTTSSTTTEKPLEIPSLPSPPTVKQHSVEIPEEILSSGSGGLPDHLLVIRQRFGGTRRQQGGRRRLYQGRGPFRKHELTKIKSRTTVASTTTVSTKKYIIMETIQAQQSVFDNAMYTPPKKKDRNTVPVSIDQTSKETGLYSEFDRSSSGSFANIPFVTSSKYIPSTTVMPPLIKHSYTTAQIRVHSRIAPPVHSNNNNTTHRSPVMRNKPNGESNNDRGSADKSSDFDSMTIFTTEKGHDIGSPYSKEIHKTIFSPYNHLIGNKAKSPETAPLKPTAKPMPSKPQIIGGNAASFTVLSNSDAFLPCEAVGNPQPVIIWKRYSSTTGMKNILLCCCNQKRKLKKRTFSAA